MKKSTALLVALTLVSGSAFASKARMAALSNSAHLVTDTQSIFDNIARITQIGDFATYEVGTTSTSSIGANTLDSDFNALSATALYPGTGTGQRIYAPDSEGGFVTSIDENQKLGFYLGRKSQFTVLARAIGGFLGQENAMEAMYGNKSGAIAWGVSVNYSASDKKGSSPAQKQNTSGMRLGAVAANWDAYALTGFSSSADGAVKGAFTDADAKYRGTTGIKVGGGYWLNSMYINGNYYQDGAKLEYVNSPAVVSATYLQSKMEVEQKHWEIGVIDTIKNDASTFFYGVSYNSDTADNKEVADATDAYKSAKITMPFTIGMEVDAASWLTLRGSVKQNILLGSKKAQEAEANTIDNSTVANAGVTFKWNKLSLDATISKDVPGTSSSGNIVADNFLTNTSLTYLF